MLVRNKIGLLATAGALSLMAGQAHAAPISFFSTGGAPQGSADPNYTIAAGPTGPQNALVTLSNGFPLPNNWFADNSATGPTSSWISPKADYSGLGSDPVGTWIYTVRFNANVGDTFSGRFWADNGGAAGSNPTAGVYLNANPNNLSTYNASTNIAGAANGFGANDFRLFSGTAAQGFNTLSFVVYNSTNTDGSNTPGNPSGLRVQADAVPEPAFFQMGALLAGGGLVALRQKRRRK